MYFSSVIPKLGLLLGLVATLLAQSPTPVQPTTTIKNCQTQVYNETLKAQTCTSCEIGYFIAQDKLSCSTCTPGCASCSSNTQCTSCVAGYFLVSNSCQRCRPGCVTCQTSTSCTRCEEGYILRGDSCETCPIFRCEVCASAYSCNRCAPGYKRIMPKYSPGSNYGPSGYTPPPSQADRCEYALSTLMIILIGSAILCFFIATCILACKYCKCSPQISPESDSKFSNEMVSDFGDRPPISFRPGGEPGYTEEVSYHNPGLPPGFEMQTQPQGVYQPLGGVI